MSTKNEEDRVNYRKWLDSLKEGGQVTRELNPKQHGFGVEHAFDVVKSFTRKYIKTSRELYFNRDDGVSRDHPKLKLMRITPELEKELERDILVHKLRTTLWGAYDLMTLRNINKMLLEGKRN